MSGFIRLPGQLPGTATNDSANAGNVGERFDATATLGSVSLTSAVDATVTSGIALTAGDWEINGVAYFICGATTTLNYLRASINTGSAIGTTVGLFGSLTLPPSTAPGANYYTSIIVPAVRVSLAAGATYNLIVNAAFGVSTLTAGGSIHALRVR